MTKKEKILIILGIVFISFNLRAPITAVGSVVKMITLEYNLSGTMAGFITTLPLIAFAIVSPFVSKTTKKFGFGKTMMFGLTMILAGEIIRSYTNAIGLFVGTTFMGVGIAIGNVLIPSIIKLKFGKNVGKMTSVYTSSMCIFAAVGAGVSVPLASNMGLGWKNALAVWVALTLFTIIIWLPQLKENAKSVSNNQTASLNTSKSTSIWKNKTAWFVTLFMGIQSLLFYSMVAWLPTIVISKGMTQGFASNMALMYQLVAIPATLVMPTLSDKFRSQKGLVVVNCCIYIVGMILFLMSSSSLLIVLSLILVSLGMGGSISLSIAFISLRSPNAHRASELSGMSQSAGYLLAAVGPTVMGTINDITKSWFVPVLIFIILIVALLLCGLKAGDDVTVEA